MMANTNSTWGEAYAAHGESIRSHRLFRALVREVAVAEGRWSAPGLDWLRRNSPTFAAWATRGMSVAQRSGTQRRVQMLTEQVASDVGMPPGWALADWHGRVYGEALQAVRGRRRS